jgi:AcrR family transcriptional regulator
LAPERRQEVLDTAAREFAARGYHETSANQVQAALGLSKGAFYYWFDDKEDLFLTAVEDRLFVLLARLRGPTEAAFETEPFWDAMDIALRLAWTDVLAHPEDFALLQAMGSAPVMASPRVRAHVEASLAWSAALLERGQASGDVRTDLPATLLATVLYGLLEALDRVVLVSSEDDPTRFVPLYLDLLQRVARP